MRSGATCSWTNRTALRPDKASPRVTQSRANRFGTPAGLGLRMIGPAPVESPGDRRDAPADEVLGRMVGRPDRHVGIPLGQVEGLVGEHDVEAQGRHLPAEGCEERGQEVDEQGIVGRHAHLAGRCDLPSGDPAGEGRDVVVDPSRQRDHLLSGRGRNVAACDGARTAERRGPPRSGPGAGTRWND